MIGLSATAWRPTLRSRRLPETDSQPYWGDVDDRLRHGCERRLRRRGCKEVCLRRRSGCGRRSPTGTVTRAVLPGMVARGRGHIVNIGSTAANYPYPGGNVYGATKAFVRQFSLNLRADLLGTKLRVTVVEPGLVGGTEFSTVRFGGDADRAARVYHQADALTPEDVAETVYWVTNLPPRVNINAIELMPVTQSFGPLAVHRSG